MATISPLRQDVVRRVKLESGVTDPETLHLQLAPTQTVAITFSSNKRMEQYRRLIYSINRQGKYRYRTLRDDGSMWGIIVWRMK